MSPKAVAFKDLPAEILRHVARILLAGDLQAVAGRRLLLQDSYLSLVRGWRGIPLGTDLCTPYACCDSYKGARSGQTALCFQNDLGPYRSSLDFTAVCRSIRRLILEDALFWGDALLLNPPLLPLALRRATSIPQPRLAFVGQGGYCLCVLAKIRQNWKDIVRIVVALPSTDEVAQNATSRLIEKDLSEGAPLLQELELRFDWAYARDETTKKSLIRLPALQTCSLLNATFAIHGDNMKTLLLAAEDAAYRWARADIYDVLRRCPRLEVVSLQMVLLDFNSLPAAQRKKYRNAGRVHLPDLRYLHISDKHLEWMYAESHLTTGPQCRKHLDIIMSMRGDPALLERAVTTCVWGMARYESCMAMRLAIDGNDTGFDAWPEYLSVSFGDDVESAMAFRDPVHGASHGSVTVRNVTFSLDPNEPVPFMKPPRDHLYPESLLRAFLPACKGLGVNHIHTFIVDASPAYYMIRRWQDILPHLWNVRRIIIYGIQSFHSPVLMDVAGALVSKTADASIDPLGLPCRYLHTIHIPDACDDVPQAAISRLNAALLHHRPRGHGTQTINWTR
ncbi:hypothetical protein PENSPDRAFT_686424 [Peniophora sp. CONT]|nr:hypothetical protein PENSPDRAFT_686424 [Peniophora sp. CONT]